MICGDRFAFTFLISFEKEIEILIKIKFILDILKKHFPRTSDCEDRFYSVNRTRELRDRDQNGAFWEVTDEPSKRCVLKDNISKRRV